MTMPIELPDEVARGVLAVARARGVRPKQVVIEAVQAEVGSGDTERPRRSPATPVRHARHTGTGLALGCVQTSASFLQPAFR